MKARRTNRPAFTLIELLVVVAIIGVLIGLTLAGVQRVRLAAARATCANHLRQLGLAAQNYHADRGRLPMGDGVYGQEVSWHGALLPYLEQGDLWRVTKAQFDAGVPIADPRFVAGRTVVKVLTCPADPATQSPQVRGGASFVEGNYPGVWGVSKNKGMAPVGPNAPPDGVLFERSRVRFADITDGTSNTLLAGERPAIEGVGGGWYNANPFGAAFLGVEEGVMFDDYRPDLGRKLCPDPIVFGPGRRSNPCDFLHFWSYHDAGANFVFCDGSVRLIPYAARAALPPLATRRAGDVIGRFD